LLTDVPLKAPPVKKMISAEELGTDVPIARSLAVV